ncbi:hypothetical protein [Nonomuraea aurantiaca]|uniref:hypothetical protein n=1 Tax=Nonomuraea aurantiaca TaxID=2878562 RepID=UPI001CD985DF|nr:hypothetical protein [Nonomuraea aurantiaca]MCA2230406.1 hypothetical protein [Nonomuraea aurantiaca]
MKEARHEHCPAHRGSAESNASIMERRPAQALTEIGAAGDVIIMRRTVTDSEQAARWQMHGSPTLLIDGRLSGSWQEGVATWRVCRLRVRRANRIMIQTSES